MHISKTTISCITATHDSDEALAFSDYILMLQQGEIESFGTPEEVYATISTRYQAGFFGEVNVIPANLFSSDHTLTEVSTKEQETILLPHQLVLSETKTKLKVTVSNSYFKGSHYLIKSQHDNLELYFNHSTKLPENEIIYLDRKSI